MVYFSYNDFMDCIQNVKFGQKNVGEERAEYGIQCGTNTITKENNKFIKNLQKEKNLKEFLNQMFNFENQFENYELVYEENLKKFIGGNSPNLLISKIKNKEIYILIYELNSIDSQISYKLFEYSSRLIQERGKQRNTQKIKNAIVIPIVIYTGSETWRRDLDTNLETHGKVHYIQYKHNGVRFSYNFIHLKENTLINKNQ